MSLFDLFYRTYKLFPVSVRVFMRDVYFACKYGSSDMFVTVDLELNTKCNLSCKYCPNFWSGSRGVNYMPWATIKKVVQDLVDISYEGNINTSFYGEPLLDKRLEKISKYIKKHLPKTFIRVFSNATLMTIKKYDALCAAGVKEFVLTGHTKLGEQNIDSLINHYGDGLPVPIKHNVLPYLVNRGGLVPLKNVVPTETCVSPSRYLSITHSGNVLLCCCDFNEENVMGNVLAENLLSIWRQPVYAQLRRDIKRGVYSLDMCQQCGRVKNDGKVEYKGDSE